DANRASILARTRSVGDTRAGTGIGPFFDDLVGLEAEPMPGPIYTGFRTRPTSTPHRDTQLTVGSAQSTSLRYRYRRIALGTNDCRPSSVCCDSSAMRRIPLPPFN